MPAFTTLERFAELLAPAYEIFKKERAVVSVDSQCAILIGDIHGNLKALEFLLKIRQSLACDTAVLLGDYVDRGTDSISVLSELLKLKIAEPENIILLKGNHETWEMNIRYGFYQEIDLNEELLASTSKVFNELPVAAVINSDVFCVHGGIPGPVNLSDISKEESFEYLWNDPSPEYGMTSSTRGIHPKCFGKDVLFDFLQKNGLSLMVRGHSALKNGYKWWFKGKLLSLFSTPDYCGCHNNGAFATFENGNINIHVFGFDTYNRQYSLLSTFT
ncbi:metallophosphoesterase [Methanolobus halotolerans]|uniref:Serine/threonine protein phosphatase n=1 Tax=Methanolobus halotolerans TaxID=2052935 RepID=A0A4E0PVR7_9EURY|nr:metallophosphoesterase [Methanolobus halotolerans]TGC09354.1 serine/threonine protein phosphatase [Methanolobus halotolerans]